MNIVVLDGFALNPGDLSWEGLHIAGDCTVYDRTPLADIVTRAYPAEAIFTNKVPLRAETIARLPSLRYIGVLATGYDVVDVKCAAERNIAVTNIPAYGTASVAQMVFALLLELCQHVGRYNEAVSRGEWSRSPDWTFQLRPSVELAGKVMGIVGYGRIGRQVAKIALAIGMRVVVTSGSAPRELPPGVTWSPLEEILKISDVLSLHCPLLPSTRNLICAATIAQMKPSAMLINTSRGALVAEADLAAALNAGRLAGAGLDVLAAEPPGEHNPLLSAANCIITPHVAWATREARARLLETAVGNLNAWRAGTPRNLVLPSDIAR